MIDGPAKSVARSCSAAARSRFAFSNHSSTAPWTIRTRSFIDRDTIVAGEIGKVTDDVAGLSERVRGDGEHLRDRPGAEASRLPHPPLLLSRESPVGDHQQIEI